MLNSAIGITIGVLTVRYFFPTYILFKIIVWHIEMGRLLREEFESENKWTGTRL